jgi:hypothetical protein
MARLDLKPVRGETSKIEIRTARNASSPPEAPLPTQPAARPDKSADSEFSIAPVFGAQFVPPSQYDDKSRYTFCMRRPAGTAASFAGSVR